MASVPIAEAAEHLNDLIDRAEAGETVEITRHGKPSVRLVVVEPAAPANEDGERKPFDWAALEEAIAMQPPQPDSGEFVRQMRDEYRY